MRIRSILAIFLTLWLATSGCGSNSSSDFDLEDSLASLEAKIPGRDRASVRVCEELFNLPAPLSTTEEVLAFITWGMQEIESSDDPAGMRKAMLDALVRSGDAVILADGPGYESAAMNFATVCTDIVSGEYGK